MNIHALPLKKATQTPICMLTGYDYPSAKLIHETDIDLILVGDSVAMTVHGLDSTIMATMDMMILHTQAVKRANPKQTIVSDMPFLSYQKSRSDTFSNAKALMQSGAHALKLEGAQPHVCETIQALTSAGIPIMGHIGLTPQSVHQLGGYKVQGKSEDAANALIEDAYRLERAGCFALVLECMPSQLAKNITKQLKIPTIGIGAGADTDGQVLVWHDMLGLFTEFKPKFVKRFSNTHQEMMAAMQAYQTAVSNRSFPSEEHCYT